MDAQLLLEKLAGLVSGEAKEAYLKTQEVKAIIDYAKNLERVVAECLRLSHDKRKTANV